MQRLAFASSKRYSEAGFTIIELLISLTITAAILALLGGGLRVLSHTSDAGTKRLDALDMTTRAYDILARDIAGMQRVVVYAGKKPRFVFSGDADRMMLVAVEPPYPTDTGVYFITYQINRSGRHTEVVRSRAVFKTATENMPEVTPSEKVTLLASNQHFEFSYGSKSESAAQWLRSWPNRDRMPDLIRLQVTDESTREPVGLPMIVAMKTDAELSCYFDDLAICSAQNRGKLLDDEKSN